MPLWGRVIHDGRECFGTIEGEAMLLHEGDMLADPRPTGQSIPLNGARLLTPTSPSKMVALVDNYRALVAKLNHAVPAEPLYFLKANNSFLADGETIRAPKSYAGKVVYEGELGIVIGKRCCAVSEADAASYIFGYTCINDVTAIDILNKDPGFAQWTRAKGFDTFGVFGPAIATDVDPAKLAVKTILNGQERQNYPLTDIIFPPDKLVSLISQDMTLEAGDVIACGTSVGVGSMKPGSTVSIVIEGIGTLTNRFE
ncbi:MAG TPA: fumarylacetoacetate hydrolase family protein [Casimicrobiaceae bacterium]|nr:fumarylacetoacetate hydrolase family protein [Casimicrobiaceae bacterium]